MSNLSKLSLILIAAACLPLTSTAATKSTDTPCGSAFGPQLSPNGLAPVDDGVILYDSTQNLCWLADANLAGHPQVRAVVTLSPANPDGSLPVINPDGTMNYQTARNWVNALNTYNSGKGWLNHNNWQLPSIPHSDPSCTSVNHDNFGALCTGSAPGWLYDVGLARTFPDSVTPWFFSVVWPLFNLQPGLYWTSDSNKGGRVTFSFNTGANGANTTEYNWFHVLPVTNTVLGPIPPGSGVVPYLSGPAAGRAVFDKTSGLSWPLDANLPAHNSFRFAQTTNITSTVDGSDLTLAEINKDGAVYFSAIDPDNTTSGWLVSMNQANYAGTNTWTLPSLINLQQLYADIGVNAGDVRLEWPFSVGPFWRLQPGFYWACVRADKTGPDGVCDYTQNAYTPPGQKTMEWSFNFDDGFEGTDQYDKMFYVMVNFPAP